MFKSFALAALPAIALARGDGDGTSQANCHETVLVTSDAGNLTVCTYNSWNSADETNEFHGDLYIEEYGLNPPSGLNNAGTAWVQFGFCIDQDASGDTYDCMQVKSEQDVAALDSDVTGTVAQDMTNFDASMVASAWVGGTQGSSSVNVNDVLTYDTSNNQGYTLDFTGIAAKNKKEGCIKVANNTYTHCDLLNNHWYRNWTTAETSVDRQITDADAGVDVPCWGWIQIQSASNDPGAAPAATWWGQTTQCKVAFTEYIVARDQAIADAADDDDDSNSGDSGDSGDSNDSNTDSNDSDNDTDTNEDGAMTVFSSAAALATAAVALSF